MKVYFYYFFNSHNIFKKRNFPVGFYLNLERFDDVDVKADLITEKFYVDTGFSEELMVKEDIIE